MKNRPVALFLLVILTACSVTSVTPPDGNISPSQTPLPATFTPEVFTATPFPTFTEPPTATQSINLPVLEDSGPNQLATALNYQLDAYEITMTAAANQISTLQVQHSTSAAMVTSGASQNTGPYVFSGFSLPPDVNPATVTDDAFLEITKSNNPKGVPIMEQYQPQIHLYPGTQTFVYDHLYVTDGGGRYYKVYDPDGHSSAEFYLRQRDIQIKLRGATPPPENYPSDVVKARATNNVIAYYIYGYDGNGKPIMEALSPRITFGAGDSILIHGARVVATGNDVFFAVYDPDGHSSIYIIGEKLEMLSVWD